MFVEGKRGTKLLLGEYSDEMIMKYLEDFKIIQKLNEKGYTQITLKTDTSDPFVHRVVVSDKSLKSKSEGNNILIDMHVRRKDFRIGDFKSFIHDRELQDVNHSVKKLLNFDMKLTVIEWMLMQDPLKNFSDKRAQLPGQRHPGLGVGRNMIELLIYLAETHNRDGLLNVPEHFNNAIIYLQKDFFFINPACQAFFFGLIYDLRQPLLERGLVSVSWAIAQKCVKDKYGQPLDWKPEEQICATSPRMRLYFNSPEYLELVKKHTNLGMFSLNWEEAEAVVGAGLLKPNTHVEDTKALLDLCLSKMNFLS